MSIYRKLSLSTMASVIGVFGVAGAANAAVMFHHGANDPTTEEPNHGDNAQSGWNATDVSASSAESVADDNGTAAWKLKDDTTDGQPKYNQFLVGANHSVTSDQVNSLNNDGWIASSRLRVVDDLGISNQRLVEYNDPDGSGNKYRYRFGKDNAGITEVELVGSGQTFTVAGDTGGYHTYALTYNKDTDTETFSIDGTEVFSDTTDSFDGVSSAGGSPEFTWGSRANPASGSEVNWNSVELSTIPEPASLSLMAAGGLLLLPSRKRRQQ